MDNQKKVKKIEIVLCVLGALLLLFSGYYIVSPYLSKNNKQEIDNAQTTSEGSIAEEDSSAENEEGKNAGVTINTEETASSEDIGNLEARQNSEQTKEEPLSAHEINPDVYEWPCGKESFQAMEEPEDVIYFAKNKDLFDAIAEEFSQYKGKDVNYIVSMSDGELWETDNGTEAIKKYNQEVIKVILKDNYIDYIYVYDIGITFGIKDKDFNNIIYSFDDEISPYLKVNISPHWWWQTGVGD